MWSNKGLNTQKITKPTPANNIGMVRYLGQFTIKMNPLDRHLFAQKIADSYAHNILSCYTVISECFWKPVVM